MRGHTASRVAADLAQALTNVSHIACYQLSSMTADWEVEDRSRVGDV
jgi:hypothetical protein